MASLLRSLGGRSLRARGAAGASRPLEASPLRGSEVQLRAPEGDRPSRV